MIRQNLLVVAAEAEAAAIRARYPQFRDHVTLTPRTAPSGIRVGEYVWTSYALALPARLRLTLRGVLAGLIDEESVEETFPDTLLSW